MSVDIFRQREQALEYEFFHKVDQKLLEQLRSKLELEKRREALAHATGITDEAVLDELLETGISAETIFALSLFPLVWVAWADGLIEQPQRKAVLEAAHSSGHERDTASHQLIESWLDHHPSEQLKQAWKDYVVAICGELTAVARDSLKTDVLHRARSVAQLVSSRYGFHHAEESQDRVLAEIEKTFDAAREA